MSDDEKDGANAEPRTYSEEEMTEAIVGAKKEGATDSYSHFQSIADKQVADAKTAGDTQASELNKTIDTLRAAHLETLSPEERTAAMIEELYKDRGGAPASAPAPDKSTVKDAPAGSGSEDDMRKAIGTAIDGMGLDSSKINWGDGKDGAADIKTFLGSVVDQVKAGQSGDGKDGGSKDGDDANKGKPGENNVDTSRGAGGSLDLTKTDPIDIITRSGKWEPVRGMVE